ncbi:MAG: DUF3995 domain-containing protein [SAR324 cluster bacterium]
MPPILVTVSATIDAVLFAAIGLLHVYWALGGGWGADAALPTHGSLPGSPPRFTLPVTPISTFLVAVLLFLAAGIVLGRADLLSNAAPATHWIFVVGTWVLAALFLVRAIGEFRYVGFFKRVRNTEFGRWDTWLFSPLCLIIALLAAITALAG